MKQPNLKAMLVLLLVIAIGISYVFAVPVAPTVTTISNSTKTSGSGQIINGTGSDTDNPNKAGGYIYTILLDGITQNSRWKAYVGNVTGRLTLDDADDQTIYDWTMTSTLTGEIYATRTSGSISWNSINCSNASMISQEEITMNHTTNPDDNISRTFNGTDNSEFYVGDVRIDAGQCFTTNTYVNDTRGISDDFEEMILDDGTNVVYATIIEQDVDGYKANTTYDFQMLLPEMGTTGWKSSTAYYFFVELS